MEDEQVPQWDKTKLKALVEDINACANLDELWAGDKFRLDEALSRFIGIQTGSFKFGFRKCPTMITYMNIVYTGCAAGSQIVTFALSTKDFEKWSLSCRDLDLDGRTLSFGGSLKKMLKLAWQFLNDPDSEDLDHD